MTLVPALKVRVFNDYYSAPGHEIRAAEDLGAFFMTRTVSVTCSCSYTWRGPLPAVTQMYRNHLLGFGGAKRRG